MTIAPPPRAPRRPHRHEKHGDVRVDDYHWLRDREDPEVRAYLEAENAYLRRTMAATADLEQRLYEEIKSRIRQTDMSVPYREGEYRYYQRYEDGREYAIHCRRRVEGRGASAEEIVLDVNEIAEGHAFCQVGSRVVSPSGRRLAYTVDTVGRREYAVRVRDLARGADLTDVIPKVTANVTWSAGDDVLFYARHDPATLRPYQVLRHRLGDDPARDRLVYEETDPTFSCAVWRSRSKRYVLIGSFQTVTTEIRFLDAEDPEAPPVPSSWRGSGATSTRSTTIAAGSTSGRTPAPATSACWRPMRIASSAPRWRELAPHRDDVLIEGFELFRDHLVIAERLRGADPAPRMSVGGLRTGRSWQARQRGR